MVGEFDVIARLRRRFPAIGDDAAAVAPPSGPLLLAADAVVAGVDADDPALLGWKAVVANVSDIAAMGGRPLHLLVTVCAPPGADLDAVADGVAQAAEACGCEVVGGDLSSTPGPLVVSVAVVGTVDGGAAPVWRSGASAGDDVYVTGPVGSAAAGRWTDRRMPRVAEGVAARLAGATAMIDVSDGLAADLAHLCDESGVGVALDDVPVAEGATLEDALHGGEDHELVFTLPPRATPPPGAVRIGTCLADPSVRTLRGAPLEPRGFEHRL